jgi:hypothetical protein
MQPIAETEQEKVKLTRKGVLVSCDAPSQVDLPSRLGKSGSIGLLMNFKW